MESKSKATKHHWIYPLGGAALLKKALDWEDRKTRQGKSYAVIEASREGPPAGRLANVGNHDVLYVYADAVRDGRLGEWQLDATRLAEHLRGEGLDPAHCSVKVFASFSGDDAGAAPCYAEALYEAMRREFPHMTVFGFRGKVDTEGFDGHKTAGLSQEKSVDGLSREDWLERGARARDNRIQFPPSHSIEDD